MKNRLMLLSDKLLLRRRAIIKSIIDPLKKISQIELSTARVSGSADLTVEASPNS